MSQLRDIGVKLRAAIAIVAVWALMFSVSASGAASAAATDTSLRNAPSGGLFACFKRHMTQRADAGSEKAPDGQNAGKHHCPLCLAAHAAAAVLPDRLSPPAELLRSPPSRVTPPVRVAAQPEGISSRSAHGARAPPFII